jgi:RNA polymerase sigma factor (sigma-70 family)
VTKVQTRLIESHMDLVDRIAWSTVRQSKELDVEELRGDGYLGLMQAARAFRRGRACSFRSFASHRIYGAMRDGIRRDQKPRGFVRKRGRVATRIPWPLDVYGNEDDSLRVDPAPDPFEQCARAEHRAVMLAAGDRRERVILEGLQREDTHEQIARQLGLSPSRVSQLCAGLVTKVRSSPVRAA